MRWSYPGGSPGYESTFSSWLWMLAIYPLRKNTYKECTTDWAAADTSAIYSVCRVKYPISYSLIRSLDYPKLEGKKLSPSSRSWHRRCGFQWSGREPSRWWGGHSTGRNRPDWRRSGAGERCSGCWDGPPRHHSVCWPTSARTCWWCQRRPPWRHNEHLCAFTKTSPYVTLRHWILSCVTGCHLVCQASLFIKALLDNTYFISQVEISILCLITIHV